MVKFWHLFYMVIIILNICIYCAYYNLLIMTMSSFNALKTTWLMRMFSLIHPALHTDKSSGGGGDIMLKCPPACK